MRFLRQKLWDCSLKNITQSCQLLLQVVWNVFQLWYKMCIRNTSRRKAWVDHCLWAFLVVIDAGCQMPAFWLPAIQMWTSGSKHSSIQGEDHHSRIPLVQGGTAKSCWECEHLLSLWLEDTRTMKSSKWGGSHYRTLVRGNIPFGDLI